jgi:hypothetical protein
VRELVFFYTVASIYLGPTLAARLRARFAESDDEAPPIVPPAVPGAPNDS